MKQFQIETDGTTVWVHSAAGHTVGRFGRMGIDVHTTDSTGCLHCTHGTTTVEDWRVFQTSMYLHHGIDIPDRYTPTRFLPNRTEVPDEEDPVLPGDRRARRLRQR